MLCFSLSSALWCYIILTVVIIIKNIYWQIIVQYKTMHKKIHKYFSPKQGANCTPVKYDFAIYMTPELWRLREWETTGVYLKCFIPLSAFVLRYLARSIDKGIFDNLSSFPNTTAAHVIVKCCLFVGDLLSTSCDKLPTLSVKLLPNNRARYLIVHK